MLAYLQSKFWIPKIKLAFLHSVDKNSSRELLVLKPELFNCKIRQLFDILLSTYYTNCII